MNRRMMLASLGGCGLLAGCGFLAWRHYRYKLTTNFHSQGKDVRAVNIVEVRHSYRGDLPIMSGGWTQNSYGEANFVDLGRNRCVVFLLQKFDDITVYRDDGVIYYPNGSHYISKIGVDLLDNAPKSNWNALGPENVLFKIYGLSRQTEGETGINAFNHTTLIESLGQQRGAAEIGVENLPDVVTFADPDDPNTVRLVSLGDLSSIGSDVRFLGATLEVTGQFRTHGIARKLPWLNRHSSAPISGHELGVRGDTRTLADFLDGQSFKNF